MAFQIFTQLPLAMYIINYLCCLCKVENLQWSDHEISTAIQICCEKDQWYWLFTLNNEKRDKEQEFCEDRLSHARTIEGTQKLRVFIPKSTSELFVKQYSKSESGREAEVTTDVDRFTTEDIRDIVTIIHNNQSYLGCILHTYPDNFEIKVICLMPAGPKPSFTYPHRLDIVTLPHFRRPM